MSPMICGSFSLLTRGEYRPGNQRSSFGKNVGIDVGGVLRSHICTRSRNKILPVCRWVIGPQNVKVTVPENKARVRVLQYKITHLSHLIIACKSSTKRPEKTSMSTVFNVLSPAEDL